MEKQIEKRFYTFKIERREEGNESVIEGTPIVFGQETDLGFCREKIDPNAMKGTDLKDVPLLTNHDLNQLPVARSRNNNPNSTMQLSVLNDGLHIRATLDTEHNKRSEELDSAISRGDVTGMSFAFTVNGEEWSDMNSDSPLRTITSIDKVYEVSAVTFPAYEGTSISARSMDIVRASLDSEKAALENARKIEELRSNMLKRSEDLKK